MDKSVFEKYLDEVLQHVQFKEAHGDIRRELSTHADEVRGHLADLGISEHLIDEQIVKRMGIAQEVGLQLNAAHRPMMDWILVVLVAGLLGVGLYSMKMVGHLGLQSIWFGVGLVFSMGFVFIKPVVIRRASLVLYAVTFLLGLIAFAIGSFYEGQPYLSLGSVNIKIVDLSVVLFVVALAGILQGQKNKMRLAWGSALVASLAPLAAYLWIGSVYPGAVFFGAAVVMMLVAACSTMFVLTYVGLGTVLFASVLGSGQFVSGEAFSRIVDAEKHTDFIFTSIRGASNLLGAAVAAMALCLVIHLVSRLREIKNIYSRTLAGGAVAIFGIGVVWGLTSNFGFVPMPVTGVNFPFLSYGGSLLVGHMGLIGVILGVYRRKSLERYE